MVVMTGLSNTLSATQQSSWAWSDFTSGHLDGKRVGNACSKSNHQAGVFEWAHTVFYSYALYNQAHALGFFIKCPRLINPIKYTAIVVAIINLYTAVMADKEGFKAVKKGIKAIVTNPILVGMIWYRGDNKKPDKCSTIKENLVWNLTHKVHAVSALALTIYGFQEHPIRAVAFFTSGAITLAERGAKLLTPDLSRLWKLPTWLSRAHIIWSGGWIEKSVLIFKIGIKSLKKLP